MAARDGDERFPLLAGKGGTGDTKIYLCQDYACGMPVQTIEEVKEQVQPGPII